MSLRLPPRSPSADLEPLAFANMKRPNLGPFHEALAGRTPGVGPGVVQSRSSSCPLASLYYPLTRLAVHSALSAASYQSSRAVYNPRLQCRPGELDGLVLADCAAERLTCPAYLTAGGGLVGGATQPCASRVVQLAANRHPPRKCSATGRSFYIITLRNWA